MPKSLRVTTLLQAIAVLGMQGHNRQGQYGRYRLGKRTLLYCTTTFSILCIHTPVTLAQTKPDEAFQADRPGLATGTYTVSPGFVAVEMGYQATFSGEPAGTNHSLPFLTFRTGLTQNLEFDIMWDGWTFQEPRSSTSDVKVGLKYRLRETEELNLSLFGTTSPDISDSTFALLADFSLSEYVQFFGTAQIVTYQENSQRNYALEHAFGASFTHSPKLATFVEWGSTIPLEADMQTDHTIDFGVTYMVGESTQIDINAGLGLTDSNSHFIGVGIAFQY